MLKYFGLICVIGSGIFLGLTLYMMALTAYHNFQDQIMALATAMGSLI
jgi:hypothetical protein